MKCSSSSDAISVFNAMDEPNSVTYNALIGGFAENQEVIYGFQVFKDMQQRGFVPDSFTFAGVLETCTSTSGVEDVNRGLQLHCQTIKFGLCSTAFIGNVLLTMYSKFNLIEEAEQVFRLIEEKDVISWNTIISSCSNCGDHDKSLILFSTMTEVGARPDNFTFASVLAACAGLALDRHGRQLHAHIIRTRFCQDVGVKNALMNMYAKCGSITSAVHVFNHMVQRNLVSWNTIIVGFANHGFAWRALEYFQQMQELGIIPDAITFIGILTACNHAGLVDEGLAYFDSMEQMYRILPNVEHLSCLIDMLGRAGRLKEAEEYLRKFPFGSDPVVLGSLLSACRLHGDVVIGQRLAGMLLSLHLSTTSPYVLLSNLYASDEMWNSVADARKMLKVSGLKKEPGYSLIEVEGRVEKFTIGDFSHSRVGDIKDILRRLNLEIMETTLPN
ncbi:Pentatricopeptide repeat [Dillenia turbinata]|uniref:Pentatricopeptide repeat n=1 Tax=Dillenia turbinata TaxID=194707 RepID=A0AAN8ZKG9_9MAGN